MYKAIHIWALALGTCFLFCTTAVADHSEGSKRVQTFRINKAFQNVPQRGSEGRASYVKDDECDLTIELAGNWVIHEELWQQLMHSDPNRKLENGELGPIRELTFEAAEDPKESLTLLDSCAAKYAEQDPVPEWVAEFMDACRRTLWCGTLSERGGTRDVAIVQWRGNLTMIVRQDETRFQVGYVSIARDQEGDGDLLFLSEGRGLTSAYKRKDK